MTVADPARRSDVLDAATKAACVLPLDPLARAAVHLVWRAGRMSPLAQQFVDECAGDR